jgi:hypothetical protein
LEREIESHPFLLQTFELFFKVFKKGVQGRKEKFSANPKPKDAIWYINTQRVARKTNTSGPKPLDSFKM